MVTFSERYGYVPPRTVLPIDEMTEHYRTDLWNSVYLYLMAVRNLSTTSDDADSIALEVLHMRFDEIPQDNTAFLQMLSAWWSRAKWYELYDVVEVILREANEENLDWFKVNLEDDFTKNLASVRALERKIVRIDSESDVEAIEDALTGTDDLPGTRHHLERALSLLSDRESPDYPNSVKESISAVESVAKEISGKPKATLSTALDALKKSGVSLHPSLIRGWQALYGYSSDADGIRHSASDRPKVDQAEARYWLVTCSAFVSLMLKLHHDTEK